MFTMVTVRCGYCSNLLSVNMANIHNNALPPLLPCQSESDATTRPSHQASKSENDVEAGSPSHSKYSSKHQHEVFPPLHNTTTIVPSFHSSNSMDHPPLQLLPIRPPEKRQRVPSAYNRFIKEEIQRIKTSNPEISHREAFSTAAKNWAHFPHIHFGLKLEGKKQKQAKLGDHPHHIQHHQIGTNTNTNTNDSSSSSNNS
ncbi:Putative axial regulator YABBY 2 [Linum grandiflorum]